MFNTLSLHNFVVLIVAVGLFVACTPTEIVSTKDPSYSKTIETLHIQSSVSDRLEKLPVAVGENVRLSMVSRVVAVTEEHHVMHRDDDGPSLEEKKGVDIDFSKARSNGVSHVMLITEEGREETSNSFGGGSNFGMYGSTTNQTWTFDVSLFDVDKEKRVWRATVDQDGTSMTTQSTEGGKMAKELVTRLDEDRLLPPPTQGSGEASESK